MKKYILLPLLFLGLCSVQSPVWATPDGSTDDGGGVSCDNKGQCHWDDAIGGGEKVKYETDHGTFRNASDALKDTQGVVKQSGIH
jgi:hypothetical protein